MINNFNPTPSLYVAGHFVCQTSVRLNTAQTEQKGFNSRPEANTLNCEALMKQLMPSS